MAEEFVDSAGASLWTFSSGQGLPLLLANGGPGCCDYLGPVARMIDDLAQVIRFEQRGCGRSQAVPPYDVDTCINDLEHIRRHYGIEQWIIGGHSWGADLALAYALRCPQRVMGLLCIGGGRLVNDREWHKEYRRRLEAEGEQLPEFTYPANMMVNAQCNSSWRRFIQQPDLLRNLTQLQIPALFVYGERDIRPSWPVQQAANLMPQGQFVSIPGAAHYIWLTHPAEIELQIRHFVSSLLSGAN